MRDTYNDYVTHQEMAEAGPRRFPIGITPLQRLFVQRRDQLMRRAGVRWGFPGWRLIETEDPCADVVRMQIRFCSSAWTGRA